MARLITCGFEQQVIDTGADARAEGQGYFCQGTPTIETTVVRSGAASLRAASSGSYAIWKDVGQTLARDYFWRFYLRFPTAPSVNAVVARVYDGSATIICSVRLSTGRLVALLNAAGTNIGSSSAALAVDTWHRIEVRVKVPASGNGELQLHVNDVAVANNTSTGVGNVAPDRWAVGYLTGTVASLYYDDVALNDDQGASQNGRPGSGKIVLLKPISDQARTGWTDGNGGTSNLYQAVDNTPPVGEATSGTTATSQVEDGTNNATDTYVANLQTYTTGGLASTDVVLLTQALATIANGASITPARQAGIQQSSNPSGSETVANTTPSVAAGTYPTGWTTVRDAVLYSPSVTLGSSPQLTLRKATASTDVLACAALGLYVEYLPMLELALSDSVGAADSTASAPEQTQPDTVTTSEARTLEPEAIKADSVTASDTQSLSPEQAQADSVTASDASSLEPGVVVDDTVTTSDARTADAEAALTDTASVGDVLLTEEGNFVVIGDSVTVTDSDSEDLASALTQDIDDSVTVTDALTTDVPAATQDQFGGRWVSPRPLVRRHQASLVDLVLVRDDFNYELAPDSDLQREEELTLLLLS